MRERKAISIPILALIGTTALTAGADWPQQRHDAMRTGLAAGTSNITDPVKFYRYYVGGSLGAEQLITYDVDTDGTDDLIYVSGGSIIAKKPDDTVIWQTAPRGFDSFIGIADLDGDGDDDIIAYTLGGSVVLEASTGTIEWAEPEDEMGTLSGVALEDLDGDGLPDLLMQECGCCSVNSGNTGYVYSFGNGFGNPTLLYELPYAACGGARSLALVDADGDGSLEVMNNTSAAFNILDGETGTILATTPNLGSWTGTHYCRAHDVDGQAGDEILCVMNTTVQPATDQRKLTVLKYDAAGPTLDVLWSQVIAPDLGGDVLWRDPFTDLDGNGSMEIVVATKQPNDVWTTRVFDAATGNEVGSVVGERIAGVAEVEESGKSLVLTTAGTSLIGYAFDPNASPSLVQRWTLDDRAVMQQPDWSRRRVSRLWTRLVTLDLTGDGVDELLTRTSTTPPEIVAYDATGGTTTQVASVALPSDVDLLRAWVVPPIDEPYPQLAMARDDGTLTLFTDQLAPSSSMHDGAGIRIGGYYAAGGWRDLQRTPVVAALDGTATESIVLRDSRGATLRLDAAQASLANPPTRAWQKLHTFAPVILPLLSGNQPGIGAFGIEQPVTDPPHYRIYGLSPDGQTLFDVSLEGVPLNDLLPADLDQDGITDLVFQWGEPGNTLQQTRGISGATGATLWDATPLEAGAGRQPAGLAAHDWNGDGRTDVFLHGQLEHHVLSGQDGSEIGTSVNTGSAYYMATVYDLDGDSQEEVTLHGSNGQPRALSSDLQTELWAGNDDDLPLPYGAVAPCAAGPVLVEGSWRHPARLKLTQMSGGSAGSYVTAVLAGGQKFVSEAAAVASGNDLGQLTSATVHANLTGQGRPTAVLGSTDGWLYGVDPCADALDFAVSFDTAVGEAVFGDTDGDGRDEVLVTTADGYLYGLKHEAIEAPAWVLDTDPDQGITNQDIDHIITAEKLSGTWIAVPGAASYEVAIAEEGLGLISSPLWQDVGDVTSASITGLPLVDGSLYFFVVRAVTPDGDPSVDAMSDGVTVQLQGSGGSGGDAGAGGGAGDGAGGGNGGSGAEGGGLPGPGGADASEDSGCGCRTVSHHDGGLPQSTWLWLLGAAALVSRRVRRRPA